MSNLPFCKWFKRKPKPATAFEKDITRKYLDSLVRIAELEQEKIHRLLKESKALHDSINQCLYEFAEPTVCRNRKNHPPYGG